MSKQNKELFENVTFNDAAYAQTISDKSAASLKRVKIGLIVAAVASVLSIVGYNNSGTKVGSICLALAFVGAIAAYIIGGGFMTAVRWAMKLARLGWIILPFPYDCITGMITLIVAGVGFFFLPVIFVFMNYVQVKRDYDAAQDYLSAFQPAANC